MPIIKSKGRKDRDYDQLVRYMFQHDDEQAHKFTYFHNIYATDENDVDHIVTQLKENIALLKKRKGGVGMYHEMISFSPKDTDYLVRHPEVIEDVTQQYMELRAGGRVGIAKPHYDKDHIHVHCCFTPNELGVSKTSRISKAKFQQIRRSIEEYQLTHYPNLHSSYVHLRDAMQSNETTKSPLEWGMEQRGQRSERKILLGHQIRELIEKIDSLSSLEEALVQADFQPYYRNDILQGIIVDNRKYRLTTLTKGHIDAYDKLKSVIDAERRQVSNSRGNNKQR